MAERGAATALPLLLLSILVLSRALSERIGAFDWLTAPEPLLLTAVTAAALSLAALLKKRAVEEACFIAVSSLYSTPSEVIAETKWLEEALRRVSSEGGHVRAIYEEGVFRVCIKARDASRLIKYLREFSSNILILFDHGSKCREVLFSRLDDALQKYLQSGSILVLAKHYSVDHMVTSASDVKVIDVSDILNINKKIVKIINDISEFRRKGFKARRIILVDLIEVEPSQLYNLLVAKNLLSPNAECIALINSVEQHILTG